MRNNSGFTLVELMIAITITLIVMVPIYSVYQSQQKSYVAQEQVAVMQQNLRSGMLMLTRDIWMAGYDPNLPKTHGFIAETGLTKVQFTRLNEDHSGTETITYEWDSSDNSLSREIDTGGAQVVAENICALDFVYLDANGDVIGDVTSNLSAIRAVQVTMVAETRKGDRGYVNNTVYVNQQANPVYTSTGDNIRRMVLSREIKCRNMI